MIAYCLKGTSVNAILSIEVTRVIFSAISSAVFPLPTVSESLTPTSVVLVPMTPPPLLQTNALGSIPKTVYGSITYECVKSYAHFRFQQIST